MNFTLRPLVIALCGASLAACVTGPDGSLPKAALDDALAINAAAVPMAVEQELLNVQPRISAPLSEPRQRRFNIAANNVDAKSFFNALANQHGISIAVHPEVDGTISLNLRQATLSESLAALSQLYGYGIEHKNGVYQVFPNGVRTRTFNVNYLMLSRQGLSQTAISGSSLTSNSNSNSNSNSDNSNSDNSSGDSTRISTESTNDFWADLESALGRLIGNKDDRVVVTNAQAGLVTVRAAPEELALVEDFLSQAERQLKRQVVLEARIIEVELSDGYEQGIDWQRLSRGYDSTIPFPTNEEYLNPIAALAKSGGSFLGFTDNVYTFTDGSFSAVLKMLETQGEVNTLSNPRVTTSNNQKAVIKVGTDEYFVTNFTLETTTSSNGNTQQSPDLEISPFFSGISLDVTPQISDDNKVLLHIHPTVSEVTDNNKILDLGTGKPIILPLARSMVRESDTIVEARSGEMIVIGGMMQETQKSVESGLPLLSRIPMLGKLFQSRSLSNKKSELVILLRPVVVEENTWTDELKRSRDLLEKWYPEQTPMREVDRGEISFSAPVRGVDKTQANSVQPVRAIDRGVF